MRVAVVGEQALAPVPGGTGRYTLQLTAALARTAEPADRLITYTAWHRATAAARVEGVGLRRLPAPRRVLASAWASGAGPAPRGVDLVHAMTLLAPPARHRPLVVTIHDAVPWTNPETLTPHGARWHRRLAERVVADGATVLTPTRAVAEELLAVLPGLQEERVHPVGAGFTPQLAVPVAADARDAVLARLGLQPGYLLSLATLEPRKGLDLALDALAVLGGQAPPLVVVGPAGWGDVDVAEQARLRGLAPDRVRVVGFLPDQDLAAVLQQATALIMPSRAEGFGLPVVEAMSAGVPVVSSLAPALTEVGGEAVLAVDATDPAALAGAIERLWADAELRERLVRAGRERSAGMSWPRVAERVWAVYRELHSPEAVF